MPLSSVDLPHHVVSCVISVHHALGTGLSLETYHDCLGIEFRQREIFFQKDVPLIIQFHHQEIKTKECIPFIIENAILLLIVAKPQIESEDKARLFAWLRHRPEETGFIVNFHAQDFRQAGLKRLVHAPPPSPA